MGNTTYDWAPVSQALTGAIQQWGQKQQYNQLLNSLLGPDASAAKPPLTQDQPSLIPRLLQHIGIGGGQPQAQPQAPTQGGIDGIIQDAIDPSKVGFGPMAGIPQGPTLMGGGPGGATSPEDLQRIEEWKRTGQIPAAGGGSLAPTQAPQTPVQPSAPNQAPMGGGAPTAASGPFASPQFAQILRQLPPSVGLPLLLQMVSDKVMPKAHTFSSTRDGQVYDTSTGQMVGTSVKDRDTAAANAQNQAEAQTIAGTDATGDIGSLDNLPIDPGQREALRSLVQTGGAKGLDTYRDVVKAQADRKPATESAPTVHQFTEGDQTVERQWNPQTKAWDKVASGARYKPVASTSINLSNDDPEVQSYVENIRNGNASLQNVPVAKRGSVSKALAALPTAAFSPLAGSRFTIEASRISTPYKKLPQFELTANGLPYLQRIDAAIKNPGSVSDQDLLDSLTKLNTAGNAITDAQVKVITDGKSFGDMAGTFANKFKNGGVLSQNQRQQIQKIATAIYANYKKGYQPVYDEAASKLRAAQIPEQFWGLPDLNKLSDLSGITGGGGSAAPAALPPGWTVRQK